MTEYASPRAIAEPPQQRGYLPGMGFDWLLPLYDPFTRLLGIQAANSGSPNKPSWNRRGGCSRSAAERATLPCWSHGADHSSRSSGSIQTRER